MHAVLSAKCHTAERASSINVSVQGGQGGHAASAVERQIVLDKEQVMHESRGKSTFNAVLFVAGHFASKGAPHSKSVRAAVAQFKRAAA